MKFKRGHRSSLTSRVIVHLAIFLLICSVATTAWAVPVKTDIVFMIDATGSMGGEIAAVKSGLSGFVSGLTTAGVDAQFAVVLYGGGAEIVQRFTSSGATTNTTFGNISVSGAVAGFQNNHNVNPEAGLEVTRMVLGEAVNNSLLINNVGGVDDFLSFRADARTNLILVTDEDSDRPFYAANRLPGQTTNEPPGTLGGDWQIEVDNTAQAVLDNNAFINMIVNRADTPSKLQYGDPNEDVSDPDFLNFDAVATLANLQAAGFGNSLEAQVLDGGLIGRTFNIANINNTDFIDNFFAAKIEEIVDNPIDPIPEPSTMILFGTGVLGLIGYARRRKNLTQ